MIALDLSSVSVLTGDEVKEKIQPEGYNELPVASKRGFLQNYH
jgi:hypothetical protein